MFQSHIEYKAPALSRGLNVLLHFAQSGEPKTMKQLSDELRLTFNQLYRIVYCLQKEGFLRQDEQKFYHLTEKIHLQRPLERMQVFAQTSGCRQMMRDFTWETNQPCHLASLKQDQFVVLTHAYPEFSSAIGAHEGAVLNTVKSSSALLYLALASDSHALQLMRNITLTTELRADLFMQLTQIKAQGYSEIKHARIIGLTSVSFPILGQESDAEAVITCPWFDHVPGDYDELKSRLQTLSAVLTQQYQRHVIK